MDFSEVDQILLRHGLSQEPAFDKVFIAIRPIPAEKNAIGLYYPASGTIVIPPDGYASVLLHELGHRYGHFYYDDLSEPFAENFRSRYEYGDMSVSYGNDVTNEKYQRQPGEVVYQVSNSRNSWMPFALLGILFGGALLAARRT